jgi:hypothetical protein
MEGDVLEGPGKRVTNPQHKKLLIRFGSFRSDAVRAEAMKYRARGLKGRQYHVLGKTPSCY